MVAVDIGSLLFQFLTLPEGAAKLKRGTSLKTMDRPRFQAEPKNQKTGDTHIDSAELIHRDNLVLL